MVLTTREAQKLLNSKRKNSDIVFCKDYKSDKEKHKFICKKCQHIWTATPNQLKRKDNIGCPKCYEYKMILKKEKQAFSKVKGATKLLKNSTLSIDEVSSPQNKINQLYKVDNDIISILQEMKNRKIALNQLRKIHRIDSDELMEVQSTQNTLVCSLL